MIRLRAKQEEKKLEQHASTNKVTAGQDSTEDVKSKPVRILGVGRGKRIGGSKEKKRTPGEIRIQKGMTYSIYSLKKHLLE